jgi:hypothetical protein
MIQDFYGDLRYRSSVKLDNLSLLYSRDGNVGVKCGSESAADTIIGSFKSLGQRIGKITISDAHV